MKSHLLSGRRHGLPFVIADDWSAEEALAAFEMLDDLRDVIWNHYQIPIQALLKQQRCPDKETDPVDGDIDDTF